MGSKEPFVLHMRTKSEHSTFGLHDIGLRRGIKFLPFRWNSMLLDHVASNAVLKVNERAVLLAVKTKVHKSLLFVYRDFPIEKQIVPET